MAIVTVHSAAVKSGTCVDCGQEKPVRAKGRCGACYTRSLTRHGRCPGCGRVRMIRRRGYCTSCYEGRLRDDKPADWTAARRVDTPDDVAKGKAREQEFVTLVLPALERHCQYAFRHFSADLREERTADAKAVCWQRWVRLTADGREYHLGTLVRQSVGKAKYGNLVGSSESAREPLSYRCQRRHGVNRATYDEWLHGGNDQVPVPEVACFTVDYQEWRSRQYNPVLQIVDGLAEGHTLRELAKKYQADEDVVEIIRDVAREEWVKTFGEPERR